MTRSVILVLVVLSGCDRLLPLGAPPFSAVDQSPGLEAGGPDAAKRLYVAEASPARLCVVQNLP